MPAPLTLSARDTLLFAGDSITDCGRRTDPDRLGQGYVRLLHRWLTARQPGDRPNLVNRGVGGDTSRDLAARWEADVIAAAPTVVSVKIGVNDVWRQLDGRQPGVTPDDHAAILNDLLARTAAALDGVRFVLIEPTPINLPGLDGNARLAEYLPVAARLAEKYDAPLVPANRAFHAAEAAAPDVTWTTDGVHPTDLGHALLARTWLDATGLL